MKRLIKALLLPGLLIAIWIGYPIYNNNRTQIMPDTAALQLSFDKGVSWLIANDDAILQDTNAMLWSMLHKASKISNDNRLTELVSTYLEKHESRHRKSFWGHLFYDNIWVPVSFDRMRHLPEYNQYFAYALSCDTDLATVPAIMEQNLAGFCDKHRLRPACVTHQMMGILLLEQKRCNTEVDIPAIKENLQNRIYQQLVWDPRGAVDVYLQRVLILEESGAHFKIKPAWVKKILAAQQIDGGWTGSQPILPLGDKHLSYGGKGLVVEPLISNLHATAQGIHLLSLLLQEP